MGTDQLRDLSETLDCRLLAGADSDATSRCLQRR